MKWLLLLLSPLMLSGPKLDVRTAPTVLVYDAGGQVVAAFLANNTSGSYRFLAMPPDWAASVDRTQVITSWWTATDGTLFRVEVRSETEVDDLVLGDVADAFDLRLLNSSWTPAGSRYGPAPGDGSMSESVSATFKLEEDTDGDGVPDRTRVRVLTTTRRPGESDDSWMKRQQRIEDWHFDHGWRQVD